jgi:hypothetical protein
MADQKVNNQKRKKKINFYKFVGKVEDQKGVISVGNDKVVDGLNNIGSTLNGLAKEFEEFKALSARNFLRQQKIEDDNKKRDKPQKQQQKKDPFGGMVLAGIAGVVAGAAQGLLSILGDLFKMFITVAVMKWMSKPENREKLKKIVSGLISLGKFLFNVTTGIVMTTLDLIAGFTEMPFWKEILKGGLFLIALGTSFLAFKKLFGGKAVKLVVKTIFGIFKGFWKSLLWFSGKLIAAVKSKGLRNFLSGRGGKIAVAALTAGALSMAFNKDGVSGKDLQKAEDELTDQENETESEIDGLPAELSAKLGALVEKFNLATDEAGKDPGDASGPSDKPISRGSTQPAAEKTGVETGGPQPAQDSPSQDKAEGAPPQTIIEAGAQGIKSLKEGAQYAVQNPAEALGKAKEKAAGAIDYAKVGISNILGGKSFFDQDGEAEQSRAAGGPVVKKAAGGGIISGPQTGYPVSLDGGKSTSFIGHGTEMVHTKPGGSAFVVPYDTPATRGNRGLTARRQKEARNSGYFSQGGPLKRMIKASEGGDVSASTEKSKVNQQQDKFGGDSRGKVEEDTTKGGSGPVSGQPLFEPKVIANLFPKGFSTGGSTDGGDNGPNTPAPDIKPTDAGVGQGKAILEGAKKIVGKKKGVGDMCAFTTRAALAAAGHSFSEKVTQKGDLDTPKGTAYNGRNFAASFGGTDMGTVKTQRSQVTAGDVILWRDYAGGRYGKGAITHVGIAATDGLTHQYDHNRRSGWHYRPHWGRSGGTEWFAGITLGGKASGAVPGDSSGDVQVDADGNKVTNKDTETPKSPLDAAVSAGMAGVADGDFSGLVDLLVKGANLLGGGAGAPSPAQLLPQTAPTLGLDPELTKKAFSGELDLGIDTLSTLGNTAVDLSMGAAQMGAFGPQGMMASSAFKMGESILGGDMPSFTEGLSMTSNVFAPTLPQPIQQVVQAAPIQGGGTTTLDPTKTGASMPHVFEAAKRARAEARAAGKTVEEVEAAAVKASEQAKARGYSQGGAVHGQAFKNNAKKLQLLQDTYRTALSTPIGNGFKDPRTGGIMSKSQLMELKAKYDRGVKLQKILSRNAKAEATGAPVSTPPPGSDVAIAAAAVTPQDRSLSATVAREDAAVTAALSQSPASMMAAFQSSQPAQPAQPAAEVVPAQITKPTVEAQEIKPAVIPQPVKQQAQEVVAAKGEQKQSQKNAAAQVAVATERQNAQAQAQAEEMSAPLPDKPVKVPVPKSKGGGSGGMSLDDVYNYRPGFGLFAGGF